MKILKESFYLTEDFWNPSREFEDFVRYMNSKGCYRKWNSMTQEQRDKVVTGPIDEYVRKHKNDCDIIWPILLDDLEDNNYHTECRILTNILRKSNETLGESFNPNDYPDAFNRYYAIALDLCNQYGYGEDQFTEEIAQRTLEDNGPDLSDEEVEEILSEYFEEDEL